LNNDIRKPVSAVASPAFLLSETANGFLSTIVGNECCEELHRLTGMLHLAGCIFMSTSILSLHTDDYRTKGLRKQLIDSLAEKGISDPVVLEAMRNIPRHFFLDPALDKIAYEDRAFPIGEGQTISQPYTVAYQSELLNITPGERVLEIGTGSAYQASVLAEMGAEVFTIERQQKLYDKVQKSYPFAERHRKLYFFYGDGFKGLPEYAPFDKVLVTAAAPFVPQALLDQLKPEGMLVIPVDEGEAQRMKRIIKKADGRLIEELYDVFRFVPMLKGKNEQPPKK
jgi:protein-L-isoaspartate(D-aspartate) O-methyltransferase